MTHHHTKAHAAWLAAGRPRHEEAIRAELEAEAAADREALLALQREVCRPFNPAKALTIGGSYGTFCARHAKAKVKALEIAWAPKPAPAARQEGGA